MDIDNTIRLCDRHNIAWLDNLHNKEGLGNPHNTVRLGNLRKAARGWTTSTTYKVRKPLEIVD